MKGNCIFIPVGRQESSDWDAGYVNGFLVFADFVSAVLEQKETDVLVHIIWNFENPKAAVCNCGTKSGLFVGI